MARLPTPMWLTLPEALAWLSEHGISEADSKAQLPRACRDEKIRTRGRGRKYTGHNTKTYLNGVAWDQASVFWEDSSFAIPDSRGYAIDITDVDLLASDLAMWIGIDPNPGTETEKTEATTAFNRPGRKPKYDWDAFFAEIVVRADLDGLPDTQAELERTMADWCLDSWGEQPSESTIRSKVALIYKHPRKPQADN